MTRKPTGNPNGRPRIKITKEMMIQSYLNNNCNWQLVAKEFGVTRQTIQNRIREYNLGQKTFFNKKIYEMMQEGSML